MLVVGPVVGACAGVGCAWFSVFRGVDVGTMTGLLSWRTFAVKGNYRWRCDNPVAAIPILHEISGRTLRRPHNIQVECA